MSKGSWLGLSPRGGACPGLESQLSWEVSWLVMEEPDGRMGALLNNAGEKSLHRKRKRLSFVSMATAASLSILQPLKL